MTGHRNESKYLGLFLLSWMSAPSCICFIIKCGIYLLLKLGMWRVWKPQTKQLEAKLKSPCFIPQQLGKTVQIKKIKELFSYHMACLACLPLLFCIKIANTETFNVILQHLEFLIVINKHWPTACRAFRPSRQKTCLFNSPAGKQCAQLQYCRSKTGPETLYSRRTDTKGMWDKRKKIGWKFSDAWEVHGGKQLRCIWESNNQHSFQ